MKVKLSGFKEAQDLLKGMASDAVNRKVLLSAQRDVLKPVVSEMKNNLRSAVEKRTGNLDEAIGVKSLRGGKKNITNSLAGVRIGGRFKGYHAHIIEGGTKERYYTNERLIHFKTANGGEVYARAKGSGKVAATHFASDAINGNRSNVSRDMQDAIVRALEKYINKKAKKK